MPYPDSVYIALGANIGSPVHQLQSALTSLSASTKIHLDAVSRFYLSRPLGRKQPYYVNAAARVHTDLSPHHLLEALQNLEHESYRNRSGKIWGPRPLDLDILLYKDIKLSTPSLCLPHPGMLHRNFVLYPLFDLDPEMILPTGAGLKDSLQKLSITGLWLYPLTVQTAAAPI